MEDICGEGDDSRANLAQAGILEINTNRWKEDIDMEISNTKENLISFDIQLDTIIIITNGWRAILIEKETIEKIEETNIEEEEEIEKIEIVKIAPMTIVLIVEMMIAWNSSINYKIFSKFLYSNIEYRVTK